MTTSNRADVFLVEQGYAKTRAEAQEAIAAGKVFDGGRPVLKASQRLNETSRIRYERAHPFVSRGALKLVAALDYFKLSPRGLVCLDLGASTGGFSEVLLARMVPGASMPSMSVTASSIPRSRTTRAWFRWNAPTRAI